MIQSLEGKIKLNNSVQMPGFGFGVFKIEEDVTAEAVKNAIVEGYRLIDTAQIYGNEVGTGQGIRAGLAATGLNREDIFVTTKVWNHNLSYDETIAAFNESMKKLGLDYLDLYLLHWPGQSSFKEPWLALEALYKEGKIKAIGVSNFMQHHLEELATYASVKPVLNQIELHPKFDEQELRAYCLSQDIAIEAYSPLMRGQILDNPVLMEIAQKHHKSVAQIVLRWDIQQDIITIVKSVNPERLRSNAAIFDFMLDEDDMSRINALNENLRVGPDPDVFDFA